MLLKNWQELPPEMQTDAVRPYYEYLRTKKASLFAKRVFDIVMAALLLVLFTPLLIFIAVWIKLDSSGRVFYRQERVTQYGRYFRIFKFRTMVSNADKIGTSVTVNGDSRITRAGMFLRKYRFDEVPQLINILIGEMTFVGTRPEVPKYVRQYTDEMMATLLLPAGVTSQASIAYKNEMQLLINADNADEAYVQQVLPEKMKYNLMYLMAFNFWKDIKTMIKTAWMVIK